MNLAAEVPMLIRGVSFEGYMAANKPQKCDAGEFLHQVYEDSQSAGVTNLHAGVVSCSMTRFSICFSEGIVPRVSDAMPQELHGPGPR